MAAVTEKSLQPATPLATQAIRPQAIFWFFTALFVLNLLLRVFYLRYQFVNGDEAIRALSATSFLDGARLYVDIVTDKPPGAVWFYAAIFALFGRSMAAVHLATIVWNFLTSLVIYKTAACVYDKRAGCLAALLFVYFSSNYLTQDMMAANTELLMVLPYTAAIYFYLRVVRSNEEKDAGVFLNLFLAGVLTGAAMLFKQLGIFNAVFFCACELLWLYRRRKKARFFRLFLQSFKRLLVIAAGVSVVIVALVLWLYLAGALESFWRYGFVMNRFYIDSLTTGLRLKFLFSRTLGYVGFNLALWSLVVWTIWRAVAGRQFQRFSDEERVEETSGDRDISASGQAAINHQAEFAVMIWALVSLAAVFAGGRFFGHYFIQVLPALAILAAHSLMLLIDRWRIPAFARKSKVIAAGLLIVFLFGLIRIHHRTAILAYETLSGQRTRFSNAWGMSRREHEAEIVSQALRPGLRAGEPLYIWDYALDVYWRTGCRPATRFITPNHVTGDFTDADAEVSEELGQSEFWKPHRQLLLDDLQRNRPRIILDPTGGLEQVPYAEFAEFVKENYQRDAELGIYPARPFVVYKLKEQP